MIITEQQDLTKHNSLRLPCSARWFCEASTVEEVQEALSFAREKRLPVMILGGGTNLVLVRDVDGLALKPAMKGITFQGKEVTAAAGENWHQCVHSTLTAGLAGLENLALIPGTVGAAPVQNIGAYGVELAERFESLTAVHIHTGESEVFSRHACEFSYRNSRFRYSDEWIITSITLSLGQEPCLVYPDLQRYFESYEEPISAMAIFDAVVSIRRAKLPDPVSHPNVGSFFKNPLVSLAVADALQEKFPGLPVHADRKGLAKLSAAWLIDQAGLKGKRCGHFAVSSQHALVLENLGDGLAADLLQLVAEIRQQVLNIYSIALETEPAFYPVSSAVSE